MHIKKASVSDKKLQFVLSSTWRVLAIFQSCLLSANSFDSDQFEMKNFTNIIKKYARLVCLAEDDGRLKKFDRRVVSRLSVLDLFQLHVSKTTLIVNQH